MEKYKRYEFYDWYGIKKGIENTDSLLDAIYNAINSECEVIDTKAPDGNQKVYSIWDGWNLDYTFYNKDIADFVESEIKNREEKIEQWKIDSQFTCDEMQILSEAMLAIMGNVDKAKKLISDHEAHESLSKVREKYQDLHCKVCKIWGEMPDYEGR